MPPPRVARDVVDPERARLDALDPVGRVAGGGSGVRQIGQFWMKRLWRQKFGGTAAKSRTAGHAQPRSRRCAEPAWRPQRF
jgi:hypothetical protein